MSLTFKLCGTFFSFSLSLSLPLLLSLKKTNKNALTKATFFMNSPLLTSLFLSLHAMIVYTSLYDIPAAGSEVELKEHHLVSERNRDKGTSSHHSIPPLPAICLLHAQYSPLNWQWWGICFECLFLYTSTPNALWLNCVIGIFFFGNDKKEVVATHKWFMSRNDLEES